MYLFNKIPSENLFRFYFNRINDSNAGMIITFHRVLDANTTAELSGLNNFIEITNTKLEEILLGLQKLNVEFLSLSECRNYFYKNQKFKYPKVHISFDDGYLDNFTLAFPLFQKYKIPFSVFIASDFINNDRPFLWWYIIEGIIKNEKTVLFEKYNFSITRNDYDSKNKTVIFQQFREFILNHLEMDRNYFEFQLYDYAKQLRGYSIPKMMNWNNINTMLESGKCEVGIHTKTHVRFRDVCNLKRKEEILSCKDVIYANTNILSKFFAYPFGSAEDIGNTDGLQEILSDCGIELGFTTITGELNHEMDKLFIPRIFLNSAATMYTLKSRLNGSYQRSIQRD